MRRVPVRLLLLPIGVGLGVRLIAPTVKPSSYDFGNVAVNGLKSQVFVVTIAANTPPGTTLTYKMSGPDVADFMGGFTATLDPVSDCPVTPAAITCPNTFEFRPRSLGVKHAVLTVTDSRGGTATVPLKGTGVQPLCRAVVVPCNFSHLYNGTFTWSSTLLGPKTSYSEHVTVTVKDGVASCNGGATDTFQGHTTVGSMSGNGLIGVEFLRDDTYRLKYKITVACPTPDFPSAPGRPAELGHYEQTSDEQEASGYGIDLKGSMAYPSPDTDALNGVSGTVSISWDLKSSAPPKAP